MSTLAALLAAPPADPAELRDLWLVIPVALAETLAVKQAALDAADPAAPLRHRVAPVIGPDLTHVALCADLITEIRPGGLYHPLFASLDAATFAEVAVVPIATLRAAGWFAAPEEETL